MSRRRVAVVGGGVTFALAGAAGAAGGQLAESAGWAWGCLLAALLAGGLVTGWTTWRSGDGDPPDDPTAGSPTSGPGSVSGGVRVGDVSAPGGQAVGVNYGRMAQHRGDCPS